MGTRCRWLGGIQEFFWYSSTASEIELVHVNAPIFIKDDFNGPAIDNTNDSHRQPNTSRHRYPTIQDATYAELH